MAGRPQPQGATSSSRGAPRRASGRPSRSRRCSPSGCAATRTSRRWSSRRRRCPTGVGEQVQRLAQALVGAGCGGDVVGVMLPARRADHQSAVMTAGRLPGAGRTTVDRLAYMVADARPRLVIRQPRKAWTSSCWTRDPAAAKAAPAARWTTRLRHLHLRLHRQAQGRGGAAPGVAKLLATQAERVGVDSNSRVLQFASPASTWRSGRCAWAAQRRNPGRGAGRAPRPG